MGNQISTGGRRKSRLPFERVRTPSSLGPEETLSQQDTLKPSHTIKERLLKLKTLRSRSSRSSLVTSTSSTPVASLSKSREHFASTDGPSTPKDERTDIVLPAPSLMTDAQHQAFSTDTAIVNFHYYNSTPYQPTIANVRLFAFLATSIFSNQTFRGNKGPATSTTANPFHMLPIAPADASLTEQAASGPMHGVRIGRRTNKVEMCVVLPQSLRWMHREAERN
ncbi:MAG: hypothetical protein Q9219_002750 [cf. Caloplaca sp. 3 TL-2023]